MKLDSCCRLPYMNMYRYFELWNVCMKSLPYFLGLIVCIFLSCEESSESVEKIRDCRHAEDACADGFQCLGISDTWFECRPIQDNSNGEISYQRDDTMIEDDRGLEIVKNLDGYKVKVIHTTSSDESLTAVGHVVNYTFENGQIFGDGSRYDALTENWNWNFMTETLSLDFGDLGGMTYVLSGFDGF